jgi:hypothetical protein
MGGGADHQLGKNDLLKNLKYVAVCELALRGDSLLDFGLRLGLGRNGKHCLKASEEKEFEMLHS